MHIKGDIQLTEECKIPDFYIFESRLQKPDKYPTQKDEQHEIAYLSQVINILQQLRNRDIFVFLPNYAMIQETTEGK